MIVKEHPVCLSLDINLNLYSFNSSGGNSEYNNLRFDCSNSFGSKQLMIIDVLTTLAFHNIYNSNKGYEIEFNEFLYDNKKPKIYNKFQYNKENIIQDIMDNKSITIKFTDKYLRKKLPCIDKIKKQDLYNLILNLSKNKIKMKYPISYFNGTKPIKETFNIRFESYLFSLEITEEKKIKTYKISFDTILGKLLINNVLSVNRGIVIDKFYKLNNTTQLLYRYLMFPFHGSMKRDLDVEEIKNRLNLKSRNYEIIKYTIPKCLETLRKYSFISKWKFDPITTKFKYEHVSLKHQKQVYIGEQLAEFNSN